MTAGASPGLRQIAGSLSVPMSNGEPVFEARWQAKAFGMVVGLCKEGVYEWAEFKDLLIRHVDAAGVRSSGPSCAGQADHEAYYTQFVAAFVELLLDRGLMTQAELDHRVDSFSDGRQPEQYLGNPGARMSLSLAGRGQVR